MSSISSIWPPMRKKTPIGAMYMTQVVICIMASDMQVKKSRRGLPRSSIIANVMPRITGNTFAIFSFSDIDLL